MDVDTVTVVPAALALAPAALAPAPAAMSVDEQIVAQFGNVSATLGNMRGELQSLQQQLRSLEKNVAKELKMRQKTASSNQRARKPSGFAKPAPISAELCAFMRREPNTPVARTEVTQFISTYIREHQLQDPANKRTILVDAPLQQLLALNAGEQLTYFNVQKYMNRHFL